MQYLALDLRMYKYDYSVTFKTVAFEECRPLFICQIVDNVAELFLYAWYFIG